MLPFLLRTLLDSGTSAKVKSPVARRILVMMEWRFTTQARDLNCIGLASRGYGLGAAADFLLKFSRVAQKPSLLIRALVPYQKICFW